MMTKKKSLGRNVNRILKTLVGAMPTIPYIMKSRKRTPVAAYVLGGLGIAVATGIAAVMYFSPRARSRALSAAKETYGKVNDKIIHHRGDTAPMSNGLVEAMEQSTTGA